MVFSCRQGHVQVITTEYLMCADFGKMMLQSLFIGSVIWNQSAVTVNTKLRLHITSQQKQQWNVVWKFEIFKTTFLSGEAGANASIRTELQVANLVEDIAQYQQTQKKHEAWWMMDEDRFPLLAFQHLPTVLCDLDRLKRRWKNHELLQDQKERVLTLRWLMSYIYIWSTHSWCF